MESSPDGGTERGGWGEVTHRTVQESLENGLGCVGQPQDFVEETHVCEGGDERVSNDVRSGGSDQEKKDEGGNQLGENAEEEEKDDEEEMTELVLFQVKECYVYKIPPRKSNLSYRADEWDINKWTWQGALRVVSKGTACSIRLEDPNTKDLFAQAPVRATEPLPVEGVLDSSRFFVLRLENSSGPHVRHAFVGLGFRERTQAYDFNAALQDHLKFVSRKKKADEAAEEYRSKPATDYSLKEGQTLRLKIRTSASPGSHPKRSPLSGADGSYAGKRLSSCAAMLFADRCVADGSGPADQCASDGSGPGVQCAPDGSEPASVGLTAEVPLASVPQPSGEAGYSSPSGGNKATAGPLHLPLPTQVPRINPPPGATSGFANFSVVLEAESVSDVSAPLSGSDAKPNDEDFGDFQAAGSSASENPEGGNGGA